MTRPRVPSAWSVGPWAFTVMSACLVTALLEDDTSNKDHIVPSYTSVDDSEDLMAFHKRAWQVAANSRYYRPTFDGQKQGKEAPDTPFLEEATSARQADDVLPDSPPVDGMTEAQRQMVQLLQERDWRVVVRDPSFRELLKKEMVRSGVLHDHESIIQAATEAAERVEESTDGKDDDEELLRQIVDEAEVRGLDSGKVAGLERELRGALRREPRQNSIYDVLDGVRNYNSPKASRKGTRHRHEGYNTGSPFAVVPLNDMMGIFQALNGEYGAASSSYASPPSSGYGAPPKSSGYEKPPKYVHLPPIKGPTYYPPIEVCPSGHSGVFAFFAFITLTLTLMIDFTLSVMVDINATGIGGIDVLRDTRKTRDASDSFPETPATESDSDRPRIIFDRWKRLLPHGSMFVFPKAKGEVATTASEIERFGFLKQYPTYGSENPQAEDAASQLLEVGQGVFLSRDASKREGNRDSRPPFPPMTRRQRRAQQRRARRLSATRPEDVPNLHYQSVILPGNKINLREWCLGGRECHEAAVRAMFSVARGYMLALAETQRHCALWFICDASARAIAEGAVGAMAATLASGVTSLYPTVVSGAGLREVISARNVGLRTADCSRFLVRECRLANGGEAG
ncbi:hypothetical protein C7M84_001799 [Penaeus vannamei]|uniref:Uncharacterized protein n=1 Tax=Penaeus vannamei TaxID=6689 RepID=A0A3R7MD82_PENVA|nr:hypothetical protein C7M84_001799 [Penaeus vannamei]